MSGFPTIGEMLARGFGSIGRMTTNSMITLPQNLLVDPGDLIDDFEATAGWVVNNGTLVADSTYVKTGSNSLKLTSAIGDQGRITKNVSWDASDSEEIRFWVYVPDASIITAGSAYIILAKDATLNNRFQYYFYFKTGWNLISVKRADWTEVGTISWEDTITYIRLRFAAAAGETPIMYFDSLYFNVVAQPAMLITFDDFYQSVYDYAYKYMRSKRMRGTMYVWTDQVNGIGNITSDELLEMWGCGWSIANHTTDHTDLTTVAQAVAEAKIAGATAALQGWGISGNDPYHFAYPGGLYNDTVIAAAEAVSMLTARNVEAATTYYRVLPLYQPYRIWTNYVLGNTTSLAQAKAALDSALSRNEIVTFYGHKLVSGVPADANEWNIDDFEDLVDYAQSIGIPSLTIDNLYQLQFGSITIPKAV